MLEKTTLGNTGFSVTRLGLGTLVMGPLQANLSPEEGAKIIRKALERGISFLDTAHIYKTYDRIRLAKEGWTKELVIATKTPAIDYDKAERHIHAALEALDVYIYRICKYIGAYSVALDGVDAIVFTAGIGENSPLLRQRVCDALGSLGVKIDAEKNDSKGKEIDITGEGSKVKVLVVPTNEELVIARDTMEIVSGLNNG
jgi:hypothetical protein